MDKKLSVAMFKSLITAFTVSLIALGLVGGVISQQVVTTTRSFTTFEVVEGRTLTTTVTVAGGVVTITVVNPGYVIIHALLESDRTCVIVFRALTEIEEQTITLEGTTLRFEGTTLSTVVAERTMVISTVYTDEGWTSTRTGIGPAFKTTITVGDMEMTYEFPSFGELIERCGAQIVSNLQTIILERAPATFFMAFPGLTVTIPGMTYTIPGMTLDIEPFTTTYTSIMAGERATYTTTVLASTLLETVSMGERTLVSTIVQGGRTVTRIVTSVETITLTEATPTTPTTQTTQTVTTSPAQTVTTTTPQQTTVTQPQAPVTLDPLILAGVVVVIGLVALAVIYSLRRRK